MRRAVQAPHGVVRQTAYGREEDVMRRTIAALLIAAAAGTAGYAAGHVDGGPYCPTEDSCTVQYVHGGWQIEPTVP